MFSRSPGLMVAVSFALGACGGNTNTGVSLENGNVAGQGGSSGAPGTGGSAAVAKTDKVDLLIVVDNSISMAEKQAVLASTLPRFVDRLVNPSNGKSSALHDLHVGVISSSLGGHGADECSAASSNFNPTQNDRAHLIPSVRPGVPPQDNGFLVWNANASQPEKTAFLDAIGAQVTAAGQVGCGFEAPLEAMYRFLVDPAPAEDIVTLDNVAVPQGVDNVLLTQRAAFLRPDSAVVVVLLSDENDCSIVDGNVYWLAAQVAQPSGGPFHLPRATSACTANPDDACCYSCAAAEPPAGCTPPGSDPACQGPAHDELSDPIQLRCWDQKRRFGMSFLYPTARYVQALTQPTIYDRWDGDGPAYDAKQVANPLFAGGRDPRLVFMTGVVGVPWQDLASADSLMNTGSLSLLSAQDLASQGRFDWLTPNAGASPEDPLMQESTIPRTGTNPATGEALAPPSAPPMACSANGHERFTDGTDLEYACIFTLPDPRDCSNTLESCDCYDVGAGYTANDPVCQDPATGQYSTLQRYGKAYPGTRQLEVLRGLASRAVVASICPKQNAGDSLSTAYGYNAAVDALMLSLEKEVQFE